jgi:hypothetical protein
LKSQAFTAFIDDKVHSEDQDILFFDECIKKVRKKRKEKEKKRKEKKRKEKKEIVINYNNNHQ